MVPAGSAQTCLLTNRCDNSRPRGIRHSRVTGKTAGLYRRADDNSYAHKQRTIFNRIQTMPNNRGPKRPGSAILSTFAVNSPVHTSSRAWFALSSPRKLVDEDCSDRRTADARAGTLNGNMTVRDASCTLWTKAVG